jgi:hypothetical protein
MQDFKFYLQCKDGELRLETECSPTDLALALAWLYEEDENILHSIRASLYAHELKLKKKDNKN